MRNGPLLIADRWHINDRVTMKVPTVREILEFDEIKYFDLIYRLYATPYQMMGELDAKGIDYEQISEYNLFWFAFLSISDEDASIVFEDIKPSKFNLVIRDGQEELYCKDLDLYIDRDTASAIQDFLRKINVTDKCMKKAGNSAMKRYLLEKARKKLKSAKKSKPKRFLEDMVINAVNTSDFAAKSFSEALSMNIYAFNKSIKQTCKFLDWQNLMHGVYGGTVDSHKVNLQKAHWLSADD